MGSGLMTKFTNCRYESGIIRSLTATRHTATHTTAAHHNKEVFSEHVKIHYVFQNQSVASKAAASLATNRIKFTN